MFLRIDSSATVQVSAFLRQAYTYYLLSTHQFTPLVRDESSISPLLLNLIRSFAQEKTLLG